MIWKLPGWSREPVVEPMDATHAHAAARIHAEDFTRPWTDGEFSALLGQEPVFGFVVREEGVATPVLGFVLARLVAGEAEILTIAVTGRRKRRGLGRMLMRRAMRHLHAERADSLFLEVDETNAPAVALYRKLGFREVGRRNDYYEHKASGRTAALVMRLDLK
ncbi:MAG: ribosomal protein S18-alanine N-acetyltransferase [Brucellaceae bacterium]|nr:ribosomal protein S18-alanine N-acetyltransferase [Brucellaceae bacterium]